MEHDLDLSGVPGKPVLVGVGGSHAYGLNHADSDVDYRGVYVTPTRELFRLQKPTETYDLHDPDMALHEVGKFLRLAAAANPSVLESLYYSEYVIKTDVGKSLLKHRDMFLTDKIRDTHVGFASAQLKRMERRDGAGDLPEDKRAEKNARHILRLLRQAGRALTTGEFVVGVEDRDEIFAFGKLPYEEVSRKMEQEIEYVKNVKSVLPPAPDMEKVDAMLIRLRVRHMSMPMLPTRHVDG